VDVFQLYYADLFTHDRAPSTNARYWQVVKSYRDFLHGEPPSIANAKQFLSHLRAEGYRPTSIILYYHALSLFHSFLGDNLTVKLRKPKTLPPYHDRGDIEALISQAVRGLYHHTPKQKERNEALILTLAYAGLRRGEAVNLCVGDIDFERMLITVRQGKGGKDRVLPMADRIVVPLRGLCHGKAKSSKVR